jgi:nicotinamide riboside transporter PnuC
MHHNAQNLERIGAPFVRARIADLGGYEDRLIHTFRCGPVSFHAVQDWLAEKHVEETKLQGGTLRWAKIAGWAGIVSVALGAIAIAISLLGAK